MRNVYKYLLYLLAFLPHSLLAQTPNHVAGTTASLIGNVFPFSSTTNNKVQWIYSPSNFAPTLTAGLITKLYIHSMSSNTSTYTNFTIKMGNTTTALPTAGLPWLTTSDVYVAPTATFTIVSGQWWEINLQTPFFYDGISNLVLECSESAYTGSGATIGQYIRTGAVGGRMWNNVTATTSLSADDRQLRIGLDMIKENDLTVTKLVSPNMNNLCNGIHEFKVRVKNLGVIDVSPFTINWSVDNVLQTPTTYNSTIQSYSNTDSIDVKVGYFNMNLNTPYNFKVWTSNPNNTNDPNPRNDTLSFVAVATRQGIVLNPLPDTMICQDGQLIIDAGYSINTDYTWSNGTQTQQVVIDRPGTYWLYAYNTEGCALRDTMEVTLNPSPTAAPIIAAIDQGNNEYLFNIAAVQNVTYWEWDFGDGSALEYGPGPKPHRYANVDDTFIVKLKLGNECDTIYRELTVVHFAKTSTKNIIFDKNIALYPIPAKDYINISMKNTELINEIKILDAVGRTVIAKDIASNKAIINTKDLPSGNYIISIETNQNTYFKTITKE